MMNKYIFRSVLCLILAFAGISCDSFLEREPVSSLSPQLFWKTNSDIESAKAAMYKSFADAMRGNYFRWGEIRSGIWEQCAHNGKSIEELINHHITDTNEADKWSDLYKTINKANLILKYVPEMTGNIDGVLKNNVIGEAYAMRALCYFYAIRVWGDVPLFQDAVEEFDISLMEERTDKEVILDCIQEDLQNAESTFAVSDEVLDLCYITLPAVYAIQMDVYAWRHQYDKVIEVWETKFNNLPNYYFSDFDSDSSADEEQIMKWRNIFVDNSTEHELVFVVKYDYATDATENETKNFFWHSGMQCLVTESTRLSFDQENDIRFLGTFRPYYEEGSDELSSTTPYKLEKFLGWEFLVGTTNRDARSENDLIMYRYSDLMLLYAEALNQQGRGNDAIKLVNKTRKRAGLSDLSLGLTKDQVAKEILSERHLELIGEGKYWFDLIRTGNTNLAGCPENRILFPIHRDHLNQNPKLVQNKY